MRKVWCLLYLIFTYNSFLLAQTTLNKIINFKVNDATLEEALYMLRDKHQVNLSFSNNIIPKKKVNLNLKEQPIQQVLKKILSSTNIEYKLIGKQVVLVKGKKPITKYLLTGYIKDKYNAENLVGATISTSNSIGTYSDINGYFKMQLPEGKHTILFSYSGYNTDTLILHLNQDKTVNVALNTLTLTPIIVTDSQNSYLYSRDKTVSNLSEKDLAMISSMGGERDILKAINNMPGVTSGADGIGGLNVRGGSLDQNLYLLDGVPIYNPTHLLGVFSIFNNESIQSAQFYKGRFPARYGGRLSSVLDVNTKDGNLHKYTGQATIGLTSAKFAVEGPIKKGKTAFFLAGRTTPLGFFIHPISKEIKKSKGHEGSTKTYFYDLNAKLTHHISDRDKIALSFYNGYDYLSNTTTINYVYQLDSEDIEKSIYDSEYLEWGNTASSIQWNHRFKNNLSMTSILAYSSYHFNSDYTNKDIDKNTELFNEFSLYVKYLSEIKNYNFNLHFHYPISASQELRFGSETVNRLFRPGAANKQEVFNIRGEEVRINAAIDNDLTAETVSTIEQTLYAEYNILSDPIDWRIGLRFTGLDVNNQLYYRLQPRISAQYKVHKLLELSAGFSHNQQSIHMLSTSGIGLPTDLWVPSSERIKPQYSNIYSLGIHLAKENTLGLDIEAYYKDMYNLIDYTDNAELSFISTDNYENNTVLGKGNSKGIEFSAYWRSKKFQFLSSYTLAKSTRQFDQLNNGLAFPYRYDRRHNINCNLQYTINKSWNIGANFIYGSGLAVSLPSSIYEYTNSSDHFEGLFNIYVYDKRNGFRLPPNHRLDLILNWKNKTDKHQFSFGVYNVYNRKNVLYYRIGKTAENPNQLNFISASLVPILPYFVYTVKF